MKEQEAIETINTREIIIKCSNKNESNLKEMTLRQDESNSNDAGYMTSSNDSLHAEITSSEEEECIDEKWKLSIPPKLGDISDEETLRIVTEVRNEISNIAEAERREWLIQKFTYYYSSVIPKSLIEITASHFVHGDSGISVDIRPNWLDIDKFQRGQKFALNHSFALSYANLLSLFTMFCFDDGLKPLIFTGASSTPYTAFKRYLSTNIRVNNWYLTDPWTAGTQAYNDIRAVRRMHAMVRQKIKESSCEEYNEKTKIKDSWCPTWSLTQRDMESTCPAAKPGQCPYKAFPTYMKDQKLSQGEMACTQFAFVGIHVLHPKFFGMHDATDEDLEAYCHLWRGLGYLLGIEDDSNFCRGTLEEVRSRSRDFLEYWVKPNLRVIRPEWEHMLRCVVEGLECYFPGSTYETCLLDFAAVLNLQLPRTYNALSYSLWIRHNIIRFYFNHGSKLYCLNSLVNRYLNISLEKARNFDEQKHEQLKNSSAKVIESYLKQKKINEISTEQSSM